jgi:hypothetical protein
MKQIRVARGGKNALTSTDPNDFIFHSEYNTFKIIAEGTYNPTLGDSGGAETVTSKAHGQSYVPFVFAFCKFVNNRVGIAGNTASDVSFGFTRVTVDATNINFYYFNGTGGNYSPTFKYYICELPL